MGGRISDAEIMEIADKGQYIPPSAANAYMEHEKIEVSPGVFKSTGKTRRLPSIMHKGQQYPILENGAPPPERLSGDMSGNKAVTGAFDRLRDPATFRQERTKQQGMKKVAPTAYNAPELDRLAVSAAQEAGLPPNLLLAIKNDGEKSNNNQVSPKGATGVMQFMPETAKAYGVDPTNPESAIKGASRFMADLIKQYRGNVAAAVAHYNGGSSQGELVAAGKYPSKPETRAYLERVLAASGSPA